VGQTSLWRRTALRPLSAPAPPPEVGGEPSLHPPSVAPASWLAQEPPGWNHHPKPPAPTGQAYWDGEPTWPGTAVAVALWWPPTLPLGRERPAGPPGSRRGVPSPVDPFGPRPSFGAPRPADADTPLPGRPFSRCRGRAQGQALPPRVPRPPGSGISQGKPVRAFLATAQRQRVRAPQGVRGPPLQPFPLVLARSPPLPRRSFPGSLPRSTPRYCTAVLPTANARPSSPPPRLRTTRGEVPALERGTRTFPPSRPRRPLARPFPLRGSGARGTPARDGRAGPQAGCSAKGGSRTLPCSA
jgi:hypothetical protein